MKKLQNFLFFLMLLALFSLGFSQQNTGNIYGTVVDEDDVPLPGVTVTLVSDLIGEMGFVTTQRGAFRFLSLSPGTYELRAELSGFASWRRENILVQTGSNVTIEVEMVPQTLEEEVTVTASNPVVDVKKTTVAMNLSVDELQSMPTARDPWVILELSPGVIMDRENVGGSESGQQSNFVSRGVGRGATNWNLDGIDTTDQVSAGAASQYYDFDAFDEIQIQTAATDITAFTAGAQVNLVTKRGSNRLSGGARGYWADENFQSQNTPPDFDLEEAKVSSIVDTGANIGGPIIRDKLWFWTGFGFQDIRVLDVVGETITTKIYNFELKLNATLGKHRIETFFNFTDNPKMGRIANLAIDGWGARYDQTAPKPIFKIQDEIAASDNLFISLKASYAGFGFKLTPIGGLRGVAISDDATGAYYNTFRYGSDYQRDQYFGQALGSLYAEDVLGADHEFKFGAEFKHSIGKRIRPYAESRNRFRDYEAGRSYRVYTYRDSDYNYGIERLGLFVQDSISLGRLTVLASLRYDRQWGNIKENTVQGTNVSWADVQLPSVTVDAQPANVIWNTFSPRLGLIYDITGDGKTIAKLNLGLYGNRYDPAFCGDLASTYGYIYWDWDDANSDTMVQSDEISRPRVRDQFTQLEPDDVFDPNLTSPQTLEITAGIERELFADVAGGALFIYRKNYNDYWSINYVEEDGVLRLPTSADWVIGGYSPDEYGGYPWYEYSDGIEWSDEEYTFQRPDFYTRYLGFELSFKKRFSASSKWLLNGSITIQDWRRYYPTQASYNDPTNVEQLDGEYAGYISSSSGATEQSINPRWMGKLGFAVQIPFDINVGGTFIIRDGYILREIYTDRAVERNEIDDNPSVYSAPYGTHRLPTFAMLNLRVDKSIMIAERAKFTFSIDAFNIFNSNTTTSQEDTITNSNYGQIYRYVSPRIFRFGVRFSF